jgi:molybdopterin synthase catalytic subunit
MIRVQADDFDLAQEIKALSKDNHEIGGICSFIGLVRDIHPGKSNQAMTLEHYPGMTEKLLSEIETEANERWQLQSSLIIHRYGRLEPGDKIVLVAAASRHREAAFEACHFLMDWLKTKAPFWKLEEADGTGGWVEARESDDKATERWSK